MNYPSCPTCNQETDRVKQAYPAMLNSEQFDSVKCGDYYCDPCRQYWWDRDGELIASERQSRLSTRPKAVAS